MIILRFRPILPSPQSPPIISHRLRRSSAAIVRRFELAPVESTGSGKLAEGHPNGRSRRAIQLVGPIEPEEIQGFGLGEVEIHSRVKQARVPRSSPDGRKAHFLQWAFCSGRLGLLGFWFLFRNLGFGLGPRCAIGVSLVILWRMGARYTEMKFSLKAACPSQPWWRPILVFAYWGPPRLSQTIYHRWWFWEGSSPPAVL